ncbi:MAG: lactate utilization protein [Patescibacteria group bacterium UBA2163]|tara:strand:- start:2439 stop:3053 length:615 start_codon:yes stop_codon:yes gene_type:complete
MNYETTPQEDVINKTVDAIKGRGINVILVDTKEDALEKVKELIPEGKSIMNGSSRTLEEIGFVDYLKENTDKWNNLHVPAMMEKDQMKQMQMMKEAQLAEYFLGSVNAIAETGELVAADASGSRIGAYPFAAGNVLLVAGVNKIVPTLNEAITRIKEHVLPLESERVKKEMGMPGSMIGKMLIFEREMFEGRTTLILVKEKLGY